MAGVDDDQEDDSFRTDENVKEKSSSDSLANYCVDLNEKAMLGGVDPLIGRESEVERRYKFFVAVKKIILYLLVTLALVKPQLPKVWRAKLLKAMFLQFYLMPLFIHLIWVLYWRARVIGAILKKD